jgi:hypothetical protein
VLDACVLVPISLCDVLMELGDDQLFEPIWAAAAAALGVSKGRVSQLA